jgi:ribosomal protein S18 acetylase RimI-like enzyme
MGLAVNFLETPLPVAEHKTSKGVVKFRVAELGDIDRLSLAFLGSDSEPDDAPPPTEEYLALTRRFFKHLITSGQIAIVGELGDDNEIVGMAYVDILERQKPKSRIKVDKPTGIIERVRSVIEREGVGQALLYNAEALIIRAGLVAAEIGVKATNERARRMYEKAGYQVVLNGHIELLPDFEGYSIFRYEPPSQVLFKSLVS